jgi:hypothetical protein
MDLRQAAEERSKQFLSQQEALEKQKRHYSLRNRALTVQPSIQSETLNTSVLTLENENPENNVEIEQELNYGPTDHDHSARPLPSIPSVAASSSRPASSDLSNSMIIAEGKSVTHISPYKDTNEYFLQTVLPERQRKASSALVPSSDPSSASSSSSSSISPLKKSEFLTEMYLDSVKQENLTPHLAKLAISDYKLNGARARANSEEVVRPRWIPDEMSTHCMRCSSAEFSSLLNRRHHCRYCGYLVCASCSVNKCLLPAEYGIKDPERVCNTCYEVLLPMQTSFVNTLANHEKENEIIPIYDNEFSCSMPSTASIPIPCSGRDATSSSSSSSSSASSMHLRRYTNMPFSLTLGSEIRKATYSIYNLFNLQYLHDKGLPLRLLRNAKGIAFLTVVKGGFIFGGKVGKKYLFLFLSFFLAFFI